MTSNDTTVLVSYNLQPDRIDQAIHEIAELVATVTREEADCLGIEMIHNLDDPTKLTLIERWTSRQAYEGPHMQTEHIQSFIGRANGFMAGPPDISFWLGVDSQ